MLIVPDDIISDMEVNNKLKPIDTSLFMISRKLNISVVFISQSYFKLPKDIGLNATHYFILKIPNKRHSKIEHGIIRLLSSLTSLTFYEDLQEIY